MYYYIAAWLRPGLLHDLRPVIPDSHSSMVLPVPQHQRFFSSLNNFTPHISPTRNGMVASQIDEKVHFRCFRVVGILHEPHHKGVAWVVVDARFHRWDHRHSQLHFHVHRHSERLIPQPCRLRLSMDLAA